MLGTIHNQKRHNLCINISVADPGGQRPRPPPALVKTSQKKMATRPGRKFLESVAPLGQVSGSATAY